MLVGHPPKIGTCCTTVGVASPQITVTICTQVRSWRPRSPCSRRRAGSGTRRSRTPAACNGAQPPTGSSPGFIGLA